MRKGTAIFIALVASLLSLLSAVSGYISPNYGIIFPFLHLAFPFILIGHALSFLIVLLYRAKKAAIFSGLLLLVSLTSLREHLAFNAPQQAKPDSIHIMSWNVRLFDLYNWSSNQKTKSNMFDFLEEQQPDILCFQEFYHQTMVASNFVTKDTLVKILTAKNYHDVYPNVVKKHHFFGLATFTKYPIIHKDFLNLGDTTSNICLFTDLLIGQDTVRVYNVHLASVRLSDEDYQFIEAYGSGNFEQTKSTFKQGGIKIAKRMLKAYKKRGTQVEILEKHINASPYPVIIMGDFNDTPSSYAYKTVKGDRVDAFLEQGRGIGSTFNRLFSLFRIDFIFLDEHYFEVNAYTNHAVNYSDHFPVSANIRISNPIP